VCGCRGCGQQKRWKEVSVASMNPVGDYGKKEVAVSVCNVASITLRQER
jgi:hypothetical protein